MPKRYLLVALMFFGTLNITTMRVNMSVAIVAMVKKSNILEANNEADILACPELMTKVQNHSTSGKSGEKSDEEDQRFDWDIPTQSYILGGSFYGYVISLLPAVYLIERVGAKWMCGAGILVLAILTLMTPLAVSWGAVPVIIVRVLEGVVQAPLLPGMSVLIARWIPLNERSRSFCIVYLGINAGTIMGMLVSGLLADSEFFGGWPSIFYVFGGFSCIWFVFWATLAYETPSDDPNISDTERNEILRGLDDSDEQISTSVPWVSIFKSVPVWSLNIATFGHLWGFYTLISEMPTYFDNILHMDMKMNGAISALPCILNAPTSICSSYIADKLLGSKKFSITTIRKLMNSIAIFGAGLCFSFLPLAGCHTTLSVVLIGCSTAFSGFVFGGCEVTVVDMSPSHTAALTAMANAWGNIAALLALYAVGQLTSSGHTVQNWNWVFIITAGIYFCTGMIFNVFGSAKKQPWDSTTEQIENQTNVYVVECRKQENTAELQHAETTKL